jgi:hypothetical protein
MRAFMTVLCLAPFVLLPAAIVAGAGDTADRIDCFYNESSWETDWGFPIQIPPYYGAVAEGYDAGDAILHLTHVCFWLFTPDPPGWAGAMWVCVWSGSPPGQLLAVQVKDVAIVGTAADQVEVAVPVDVTGWFTVGFWCADFGEHIFVAADLDGFNGHPWVNIPPGSGYPTGWQPPSVTGTEIQSLALGYLWLGAPQTIPDDAPGEPAPTWGRMKGLFR